MINIRHIFISAETVLKIYDGEVSDPKLCKNITIPRTAQASNVLVSAFVTYLFHSSLNYAFFLAIDLSS